MKLTISVLVIIHLVVLTWHGEAHAALAIELPALKTLFVYIVIVAAPIISAALSWTRFSIFGICLFTFAMAGSFLFGAYHHYVLVSPDNIAHLPAGLDAAHSQFIESAAYLASVALFSSFLGFSMLGYEYANRNRVA